MKLTKVSLAALVALGAFSSVASATPLEEAIKNVDLSGFARYRYTNDSTKNSKVNDTAKGSSAGHAFRMETAFKAAIDDNFFGVLRLRYSATDGSGDNAGAGTDKTDTTGTFGVYEMYLGYKVADTTITAGKQLVKGFFIDSDIAGTGLKVVSTDVPGLTLTAAAYDAIDNDADIDRNAPAAPGAVGTPKKDAFGHVALSGTASCLANILKDKLKCKTRAVELNTLQRCAAHYASATDIDEAFLAGEIAVTFANSGKTGIMVAFKRDNSSEYNCLYGFRDIDEVANKERKVPDEFITDDGVGITKKGIEYLRPLILGELEPIIYNGLPRHILRNSI